MQLSENQDYLMYGQCFGNGDLVGAKNHLLNVINAIPVLDYDNLSLIYYLIAKIDIENQDHQSAQLYIQKILKIFPNDDFWINQISALNQNEKDLDVF